MGKTETGGITPRATRWLVRAVVMLSMGNAAALAVHDRPVPPDPIEAAAAGAPPPPTSLAAPAKAKGASPTTTAAPLTAPGAKGAAKATSGDKAAATTTTTVNVADQLWPLRNEGYDYVLTLTPTCAKPGQAFTATMRLKPTWGSGGVFMPFYADGSFEKGKGAAPEQGGDGTVTYTWVARPVPGEGRLVTQAHDPETDKNGTKVIAFRVAEVGKSC